MKSNHKTFTLIELIIVVAIVAILAGAMIPAITSARQKARAARLLQLIDTLRHACVMFNSDTGDYAVEISTFVPPRFHYLWADPGGGVFPGWNGPYIERPLTNEDAYPGNEFYVWGSMYEDFDLDGDGAIDKNRTTEGNSIVLWGFTENETKAINDQVDMYIPGDWRVTGKVKHNPFGRSGRGRAIIYLIGGS